jgi:hypothetical protein
MLTRATSTPNIISSRQEHIESQNNSYRKSPLTNCISVRNHSEKGPVLPQQRTLDSYGITVNISDKIINVTGEDLTIFTHQKNNQPQLRSGAYISDPKNGDKYGAFRFYSGLGLEKYQTTECTHLQFERESLSNLRDTYHNVKGVTAFLRELLDGKPCADRSHFNLRHDLFEFFPPLNSNSNGFLIYPNLPYIDFKDYSENPASLKDRKNGITLGAWAVHPNQNLEFIERLDQNSARAMNDQAQLNYNDNNRTLSEIEHGTTVKYLSSILDFGREDIAMLKKLNEDAWQHLHNNYDVKQGETTVKMFFHFPVATKTATVHLHVWVNKADHPLNNARSFELTEIIDHLENGGDIQELILARNNGAYFVPTSDTIKDISTIPNMGTKRNPYILNLAQPFEVRS